MAENQDFKDLLSSLITYLDSAPHPDSGQNDDLYIEEMDKACKKLSDTTRTLFGPRGWRKLVFTSKEYNLLVNGIVVEHPAAKALVRAAKFQQDKCGDGANLVVLIAGQHIKCAIELMNSGMNPSQIINGYNKAIKRLVPILRSLARKMDVRNEDQVIHFMKASFISSNADDQDRHMLEEHILSPLIAHACIQVCPEVPAEFNVDNVRVARLLGVSLSASKTFRGMVLKVDTVAGSIKGIHDAKVLVIAGGVDTTDSEQLEDVIKASRAKVIVSGAGVGQKALQFCDDNKIMVLKIASNSEFDCFCRTTDAVPLLKLGSTVDPNCLGHVDSILVEKTHGDRVTVTNKEGGVATVLLGVSSTAETEYLGLHKSVVSAVNTFKELCSDSRIVPGAGATEFEIARQLRVFAFNDVTGLPDESIRRYADSFELIPKTLAQNARLDVEHIMEQLLTSHRNGNVEVGIDMELGEYHEAVKLWDRYSTKRRALEIAAKAVRFALKDVTKARSIFSCLTKSQNFIVATCKKNEKRNSELVKSLKDMLSDRDFKKDHWLGEVVEVGDTMLGLSPKGCLISCDKVSKKVSLWDVIEILPAPMLDDYSYVINYYIMTRSDRVMTTHIFIEKEELVKEFTSDIGNCTMSKLVEKVYIDPHLGQAYSTRDNGRDVCVRRCDIVLRWFEGVQNPVETRMEDRFCMLRISLFDISILNDKLFIKEDSFPPGKLDVKWLAESKGGIVKHQLNIDVVCVKVKNNAVDWAGVRKYLSTIQNISHTCSNILMVHDVQLYHNVFHCAVERFGTPLTKFMNTHEISHKNMLKIIRGLVNGIRALHIKKVAIRNLNRDNIFVDDNWNVKVAPINLSSASTSTSTSMKGKTELKKIEMIKNEIFSFADLEADMKANMEAVGKIIFWCYTKRQYNNECDYFPFLKNKKQPEYMKKINTDVADLLNKLLSVGATAMDVATYYIFWTEEKTLDFIRAVTERLDSKDFTRRGTLENAKASIFGINAKGDLIPWTTKFPADFIDAMKTNKHGVLIKDNGTEDKKYEYDGLSVYQLYQIIRNLLAHENSVRKRVASIQGPSKGLQEMFDKKKGFCSFLMKLFPNLIREAYHPLKDYLHQDHRFTKFYKQFNPECD